MTASERSDWQLRVVVTHANDSSYLKQSVVDVFEIRWSAIEESAASEIGPKRTLPCRYANVRSLVSRAREQQQ